MFLTIRPQQSQPYCCGHTDHTLLTLEHGMPFKALTLYTGFFYLEHLIELLFSFQVLWKMKVPGLQPQRPWFSKFSVGPGTCIFNAISYMILRQVVWQQHFKKHSSKIKSLVWLIPSSFLDILRLDTHLQLHVRRI